MSSQATVPCASTVAAACEQYCSKPAIVYSRPTTVCKNGAPWHEQRAVAVARKLTVAVWHVLKGHWNQALEETTTLLTKLTKLATELGVPTLKELGYASKIAFQDQKLRVLRTHP